MKWRRRHAPRILLTLIPLLLALAHAGGWMRMPVVDALDAFIYDARLRASQSQVADPRIVIVDIDDASLQQYGQWPWSRERLAQLTRELTQRQRVGVLGFDIMFVENERNSGHTVLQALRQGAWASEPALAAELDRLARQVDHDRRLTDALRSQPAVLGFYFSQAAQAGGQGTLPPAVLPDGALPEGADHLPRWNHYGASLSELAEVAPAGFLNVVLDPRADGVVRAVPMLARYEPGASSAAGAGYYESLGLAVYRRWLQAQPPVAVTSPADEGPPQLQSLLLQSPAGLRTVPVDPSGQMLVPYRGDGGPQGGIYRYVPAAQVLEGRLAEGELAGKAVLVGTSAAGLRDLRATPVNATFPGVEIHATVLSALLDGRFVHQPPYAQRFAVLASLVLIGGLALALAGLPASAAMSATLLGTAAVAAGAQVAYLREGLVLPLAALLLGVGLAVALNLAWGYFVEARMRRQLARLFGSYVPPQLVGEMLRDPARYTMRAESKELTVMFCDMRGFTRLSEGMTPAQLQPLLNSLFSRLTAVISRHRGTVDKYMGDCVMAFWGAPLDAPDHADLAVRAAHDLVAEIAAINREHLRDGLPPVQLGIGLNTGVMHVGDMGSTLRRSYTVIGDAVNLAARLEGLGERYGVSIVAGPGTREKATAYLWQELDQVRVKGRQQAVRVHTPRGLRAEAGADLIAELDQWQQLRDAYMARQWPEVQSTLQILTAKADKKVLYRLYEQRLALLLAQPPGPEWDGTEEFQTK
ncbi:CHASE2 domain-containing protein [Xenophilus sp. Marseille-Q4582]|uniref:CHASE2 domain-containing protein n=1 Tax=Xenophilus sp. Marseille-Q4582 TaxID=2866600 RepID=UPI001CE47178|nr:adenylate/guanylate cyclase domain-containing protein [Xenophilus sp. Marseille-Q4582]